MATHDEVLKIAALAKLYISGEQLGEITGDLNSIIAFADTISAVDASGYEGEAFDSGAAPLREDAVSASYTPELILANAMEAGDGFFVVRDRGLS